MRAILSKHVPAFMGLLGFASLGGLLSLAGPAEFNWTGFLLAAGLVAVMALSPIPLGGTDTLLAQAILLPTALAFGPIEAGAALGIGLALGEAGQRLIQRSSNTFGAGSGSSLGRWSLALGQQGTSLLAGSLAFTSLGGQLPIQPAGQVDSLSLAGLAAGHFVVFIGLQGLMLAATPADSGSRSERIIFLGLVALLPLPYGIVTALATRQLGNLAFLTLAGGPAVIAPIFRSLMLAERTLQRRLGELSTLGEVSQAMRTSLNLDAILHTIYLQVGHLLGVHNFYVALHDEADQVIRYPLAIKNGERQRWADRMVSDRLTDRVIRSGKSILIARDAPRTLREMGLPELANAPESWLGVPLQTPNRILGCMGVFHSQRAGRFTEADRDLLETLAGQASIAIENAVLYQQTRRRAQALASLNEITTQMSSSLDPEQTLQLVAHSLTRVVGAEKAAIYLATETGDQLDLVESIGLPETVQRELGAIRIAPNKDDATAFLERRPVVQQDLATLDGERAATLVAAGIRASVDVPLSTPSGPLGIASVFFPVPTTLDAEQLELLETFVAQSAIAVANARAHAATDQALQRQVQQLSRLETIGREMVSTLDPDHLFLSILDSALTATGTHVGHLTVAAEDEGGLTLVAHRGYAQDAKLPIGGPHPLAAFGLTGQAARTGETLVVADLRMEPEHGDWSQGRSRSLLAVPIRRWGRTIGVISVEGEQTAAFAEEHDRFLSQLAAYAAVAITNAGLYRQLEENLREQSLLFQASAQISTSMDVDAVALAVADSLAVALGAERVSVYERLPGADRLHRLASINGGQVETGALDQAGQSPSPELWLSMTQGAPRHFEQGQWSVLAIPLRVGAEAIGVAEIAHRLPHQSDETELRRAQTIASQAAIALQNTDLFRRIQQSHERLVAVLNSTQEAILMVDRQGRIQLANQQVKALFDITEAELVGQPILDPALGLAARLGFAAAGRAGSAADPAETLEASLDPTNLQIERPAHRFLRRLVQPVLDVDGDRMGWLIVLRDITEERELEETREQLTEMIVHDLRSPLTTILGSLSLLEKAIEANPSPISSQALSVSRRSLNQMLGLVNSLLDLAQMEDKQLELQVELLAIGQLCQEIAETFVAEANENGLILEVGMADDLPPITADREKLRRVIGNLLDNALKFTPEGGRIGVTAGRKAGRILVTVSDRGPGVPAEMRDRVFERFGQVPGVAGRRRGTGLGLAFAKLAVEAHGGRIWVEDNPGGGSAFKLELPAAPPGAE